MKKKLKVLSLNFINNHSYAIENFINLNLILLIKQAS